MKRVAIFASYFKEGIIPEYVVYYLQGLKKLVDDIVYIADSDVKSGEEEKIRGLVTYYKCERHGCYDFGSYRRGFEWAEQNEILDDADELIFCNDSCYGPVYPFEDVFVDMDKRECDFWGMTESNQMMNHLQSFFLVFKKGVFKSSTFIDFVHSFEKQESFMDYVLKYEIQFASVLSKVGFRAASYVNADYFEDLVHNPTNPMLWPIEVIERKVPLIKRKVIQNNYDGYLCEPLLELLYHISKKNEKLFSCIKNDMAPNDIQFIEKLYKQNKNIHDAMLKCIVAQKRTENKNKKHLKQLRWMIYTNIMLAISLFVLALFAFC